MPVRNPDEIRAILEEAETIAVVGMSSTPHKEAHQIPKYLIEHGYDVIPVNPTTDEVLGRRAYDDLATVEETIDVVDVFRPSDEVMGIVEAAVARDDAPVIWTQLGIRDPEATALAEERGLRVVEDRCIKVEHQSLL
jgi:hypothetical protein